MPNLDYTPYLDLHAWGRDDDPLDYSQHTADNTKIDAYAAKTDATLSTESDKLAQHTNNTDNPHGLTADVVGAEPAKTLIKVWDIANGKETVIFKRAVPVSGLRPGALVARVTLAAARAVDIPLTFVYSDTGGDYGSDALWVTGAAMHGTGTIQFTAAPVYADGAITALTDVQIGASPDDAGRHLSRVYALLPTTERGNV